MIHPSSTHRLFFQGIRDGMLLSAKREKRKHTLYTRLSTRARVNYATFFTHKPAAHSLASISGTLKMSAQTNVRTNMFFQFLRAHFVRTENVHTKIR